MSRTQKKANYSLKEIAEKLGISQGAVSLALNDSKKISVATKKRVQDMAKKLGYKKKSTCFACDVEPQRKSQ